MSLSFLALTSAQMLVIGIVAFVFLASMAVWFYGQASKGEDSAPLPKAKAPESKKPHFIPVVVPVRTRPNNSKPVVPAPPIGGTSTIIRAAPPQPPPPPVIPAKDSSPQVDSTPVPASRHFQFAIDIRNAGDGTPALFARCRGLFADIPARRMFFEVNFRFADNDSAQLTVCPRLGSGWIPLRLRRIYDEPLGENEWCELGSVSLRDLAGPVSGIHLVQATCSAYACEPDIELAEAMPDTAPYCSVAAGIDIPFLGLGYEDFAVWLVRREKALAIAVSCAGDEVLHWDVHVEAVRVWIANECGSLVAHPEFKKMGMTRLLASLDASHFGVGTTFDECNQFAKFVGDDHSLLGSVAALFSSFGESDGLDSYAIERIHDVCLWLGMPCPGNVEAARVRLASKPPPVLRTEEPGVGSPRNTPSAGFPFTVSLSLIGTPDSASGFRVMVSGDLPVRTSPADDLYFSVSVSDSDDKTTWPFLVSATEVDGLNEVIKPSVTIARDLYDPAAPRQVAEIFFKDCAFPRHGERTLQASCAGYSIDSKGALTRLCFGDASGTVKIPGTGYVTLRKRRRSLRGLMLELAVAAGTAGSVMLGQKTIAKDWISGQAAGIADPDERKLTVNYLTKVLLGVTVMSTAEIVALASKLVQYHRPKSSQESLRLARLLVEAKPEAKPKFIPILDKVRRELGLPGPAVLAKLPPVGRPPAPAVSPVATNPMPVRVARLKLNTRQVKAKALSRKLARSVTGWKAMSGLKKIAHLRSEILGKSARMPGLKGLAERYSLQSEITDMSELVVMLRSGVVS
jgi:hypothetical protein